LNEISPRERLEIDRGTGGALTLRFVGVATWLLKSEPDTFGYHDLVRNKREGWDGVRNYQARNFMREMQRGDLAIFYHSNAKPPGVAGICKIVKTAEPDPTQFDPSTHYYDPASSPDDPRWDWVTVAPVRELAFVSLDELKQIPELTGCRLLAKGNRLSVMPITDAEFEAIVAHKTGPAKTGAAKTGPAKRAER
jgi:predicted RNA-binding protein with PUA-like domain